MRKTILLPFLLMIVQTTFAQNKHIDSLKSALANTKKPVERFNLLYTLEVESWTKGKGGNSIDYGLEMLRIAKQQKSDSLMGVAYAVTGSFYLTTKGDFNTALNYSFNAIPYSEKTDDKVNLSGTYVDISNAYAGLKNPVQQLSFAKKAEVNLPEKTNIYYYFIVVQVKLCFAQYYINMKQPEMALRYTQAAKEANLKRNDSVWEALILVSFGRTYELLGDNDLAEAYFKKAALNAELIQFPFAKYSTMDGYISFLLHKKDFQPALTQAKNMLQLGEQNQNDYYKLIAAGYLKDIFDRQNKIDSAYYYSKQESSLKEIVFNQENFNKAQEKAINEELRLTEEQNKKAEAEHQRREYIQFALITLGIIGFLIVFLVLSRTIITNTKLIHFLGAIALLLIFEFLNLLLHPFLERVTEHSPPLMLLALVGIAALLVPLHHRMEKRIIESLIAKNKKIRLAEAKKQQ